MTLNLDRITHPLRLAAGSHQPGSGKGCAMNVISYINGDTEITDFPTCSASALAMLVQGVNDGLADEDTGFLSPEAALIALELGWLTVGTGVPAIRFGWLNELTKTLEGMGIYSRAVKAYADIGDDRRAAMWAVDAVRHQDESKLIPFVRHMIEYWRGLAGLDQPQEIDAAAVDSALERIGV